MYVFVSDARIQVKQPQRICLICCFKLKTGETKDLWCQTLRSVWYEDAVWNKILMTIVLESLCRAVLRTALLQQ